MQKLLAAAATGALTLVVATAVPATAAPVTSAGEPVATDQTWIALTEATDLESPVRTFDFAQALANGAQEPYLTDYASGFVAGGGTVLGWNDRPAEGKLEHSAIAAQSASACIGRNDSWNDVWGWHWEMDSCGAEVLSNNLAAGVVGSGLVAAVGAATGYGAPVGLLAAVAGAQSLIAVTAVNNCRAPGTGITVHITGVPWCGAQT